MARTRAASGVNDAGDSGSASLVPAWEQRLLLMARVVSLVDAFQMAVAGGGMATATAARMMAEIVETAEQARKLAEQERNQ